MKKLFLLVFICAIGCGFSFTDQIYAQTATPYLMGFVLDLTGRASSLGGPEKNALEIAIEGINEKGGVNGRHLKPIIYDAETDSAKAVINTKRLIDMDNVIVCAGYSSSGTTMASIQTAEAGSTVLISASASEKIWIPTKKWVFNVVARQKEGSIPFLVEELLKRGCKKIGFIYIDTVYGQTGKETFDEVCKETKITPAIVEKYAPGSTDVGPQITHCKTAGVDGLLITGYLADTVMVIKNARDLGFTHPIVSDYAIVGPEFIKLAGKYGEGIVTYSNKALVAYDLPDTDVQKKIGMALLDKYTSKYGPFSIYACHTWDQVHLIAEALKKVNPRLDPTKKSDLVKIRAQIRDNLEKIKGFVGQNGIFNYSNDNHNGLGPKCYVPVVVKDGKWRLYKEGM